MSEDTARTLWNKSYISLENILCLKWLSFLPWENAVLCSELKGKLSLNNGQHKGAAGFLVTATCAFYSETLLFWKQLAGGEEPDAQPLPVQPSPTDSSVPIHRQEESCQSSWAGQGEAAPRTPLPRPAQFYEPKCFRIKPVAVTRKPVVQAAWTTWQVAFKI